MMEKIKVALIYAPANKQTWQALHQVMMDSAGEIESVLIEVRDEPHLIQILPGIDPALVLLDPDLERLRSIVVVMLPDSTILDLNELLTHQDSAPGWGAAPREIPPPKILAMILAGFIHEELTPIEKRKDKKEATRGGYDANDSEAQPHEELVSRSDEDEELTRGAADLDDSFEATPEPDDGHSREDTSAFQPPPPAPQAKPAPAPPKSEPAGAFPPIYGRRQKSDSSTLAGKRSGISIEEFANPQFSAYYPSLVAPSQSYALMAFAHIESAANAVAEIASSYKQIMGGRQSSGTASSKVKVAKGTVLTLVPQIDGITFTPAEHLITWAGETHYSATFLFQTPADLVADLTGRIAVYNGPLILGEIPLTMTFADDVTNTALNSESHIKKYEPIFASYSHRDTPVMRYFRRTREKLGQQMLVDVYDLRAGEHWAERLLEMIDESAVFQLFWSKHAANSTYCRQEWEHALKLAAGRERFIQPVWWADPMPTPPLELSDFHFQRINLPVTTRARMRLGRLFGRG